MLRYLQTNPSVSHSIGETGDVLPFTAERIGNIIQLTTKSKTPKYTLTALKNSFLDPNANISDPSNFPWDSDFQEPSQGGITEPSFHKFHRNTKVVPRLVADDDNAAILVEKRNNYYLQSHIPSSDYNYSWVTSSLGDNYSVRSGKQKVFGYWPKDGILIRNIKKGAKGTYYETQVTASTFESAISFPTGSQIHGS